MTIPAFVTLAVAASERNVPLVPDGLTQEFYVAKGVIGLIATVLLVIHMAQVWDTLTSVARRWRYGILAFGAALITYASGEQIHDNVNVDWRNFGAMVFVVGLLITAILSLREDRRISD